jgi:peptidoglycan/xylan/chitin deacetylase (PgdA/CDA1 family)
LLAIADFFVRFSLLWYGGIIIAFAGYMAQGSANIRSGLYCRAHCSGKKEKKSIALSFDDGPDRSVTPLLLDLLSKEGIKACFFCIGRKAEQEPDIIKRIDGEGHIIGGHSYSHHFFFDLFRSRRMLEEMQKSEEVIISAINRKVRMFRPPYGVTNPPLAKALRQKKYHVIGWSLRSKDTVITDEKKLFDRLVKRVKPGDIILFHDTKRITVNVLEKFIKFASENGFSFDRLDKHLGIEAYE